MLAVTCPHWSSVKAHFRHPHGLYDALDVVRFSVVDVAAGVEEGSYSQSTGGQMRRRACAWYYCGQCTASSAWTPSRATRTICTCMSAAGRLLKRDARGTELLNIRKKILIFQLMKNCWMRDKILFLLNGTGFLKPNKIKRI